MNDEAMQVSDRKALVSLITCVASVLAVVVLVVAVSVLNGWPSVMKVASVVVWVVGTVVFFLANILDLAKLPVLAVLGVALMVSTCLAAKGFARHPGEGAAAWRVWLSDNLGASIMLMVVSLVVMCMVAMLSYARGGDASMAVYSDLVKTERETLAQKNPMFYWVLAEDLSRTGSSSHPALRSACQALVRSTPASALYVLTVNGRPAAEDSCGWGVNQMAWSSK